MYNNAMEWLNYHHLYYFWMVAREGTIARACKQLMLAQPTVTAQIHELERALGQDLFRHTGRTMQLTEIGQIVFRYAEEIFSLGREMMDAVRDRPIGQPLRFTVGIADVLPKRVVYRLLEPALRLPERVRITCQEDRVEHLLVELAVHRLDIVLADAPISPNVSIRGYNHFLGDCGVSILGVGRLAVKYARGFPQSLAGAPFLVPTQNAALRRSLESWLDARAVRPLVEGEFEDSALLETFGASGIGLFPVPNVVEAEVRRQYNVQVVGRLNDVRMQFYAVSVERRLKHPAVIAVSELARSTLFGEGSAPA